MISGFSKKRLAHYVNIIYTIKVVFSLIGKYYFYEGIIKDAGD